MLCDEQQLGLAARVDPRQVMQGVVNWWRDWMKKREQELRRAGEHMATRGARNRRQPNRALRSVS